YLGVQGLRAGCRSGGCGVCKVRIESGEVRTGKMSKAHVTENDRQQGVVLACRTYPLSDITLSLVDERVGRAHP
ncbi:MAG: 2Fe-2S iron-sulfur cluster-binding protein, partial [Desulfobacterales bacterium]|nr:2Fe-2S iron-sulfur cluster-binding protein [Desulfobacterales bacterium]